MEQGAKKLNAISIWQYGHSALQIAEAAKKVSALFPLSPLRLKSLA